MEEWEKGWSSDPQTRRNDELLARRDGPEPESAAERLALVAPKNPGETRRNRPGALEEAG